VRGQIVNATVQHAEPGGDRFLEAADGTLGSPVALGDLPHASADVGKLGPRALRGLLDDRKI
jgi:hypothetical protein